MKQERINKAIETMNKAGMEAVVYSDGANLQYLLEANDFWWQRSCDTNIMGRSSAYNHPTALLYLNNKGDYEIICQYHNKDYFISHYDGHVVPTYMDQFEDAIAPFIKEKKIGIGFPSYEFVKNILLAIDEKIEIMDAEDLLKDIRCFKDEDEIKALRSIAKFTDDAVMYVVDHLKTGMTMREAENLLVEYGYMHNVPDFSFPPTVGFKTQNTITSATVEYYDREWKLKPQTGIAFDVGYMKNGYCSDWGRTVYFGKAPEKIKAAYHALQEGQKYMVEHIIPYKTNINECYKMVLDKVTELGFGDDLRFKDIQMLGHQIGIDCHEFPMVNKDNDFIIKPGMVFASEPKMYFKDELYMRVEDIVLITEKGAEFLTNFPRDLFEIEVK